LEKESIKVVVDLIRESSSNGKFIKYEDLNKEPISLKDDDITKVIENITLDPEYADIVKRQGKEHSYLYSNKKMTENYASIVFRVEEKELLKLLVETVRYESKTYPRPTTISLFSESPFNFNNQQVCDFLKQIIEKGEYSDILKTKASNGSEYLYSSKYLTNDYAVALTQWIEVDQFLTP